MITEEELNELEMLLDAQNIYLRRESLRNINTKTNPNYKILYEAITNQRYNQLTGKIEAGKRGCILEGSSRSGKTWSGVDIIIFICLFLETRCVINIVKETYNEFKTTLYNDFKKRLPVFGIPHPFDSAEEVKGFKIGKNKINFLGADKPSKFHGAQCDYLFFNEMLPIKQTIFDQAEMRCTKFWWGDYNPSVTEHYIFKSIIPRNDIGFIRTTFHDNPNLSFPERNKILGYEPWLPNSYKVENGVILCRNKVTKKMEPVSKTNQPPPHPTNIFEGTADEFMWKVYGLGLRGAMKGLIFQHVEYIDKFPDHLAHSYGMDFGFTTDPTTLVKCAEDDHNIYLELLLYEPTETPDDISDFMDQIGVERNIPITADSSDKHTGENKGTVEMVSGLKKKGWTIAKVSKTKGIMFWVLSMKRKKIHIVKNHLYNKAKTEQENYRLKEIGGICINQPAPGHDHFWDGARYRHMAFNSPDTIHQTEEETINELGINY